MTSLLFFVETGVSIFVLAWKSYQCKLTRESGHNKNNATKQKWGNRPFDLRNRKRETVATCASCVSSWTAHRILASRISMGEERTSGLEWRVHTPGNPVSWPTTGNAETLPCLRLIRSSTPRFFIPRPLGRAFRCLSLSLYSLALSLECYYGVGQWKRLDETIKSLREPAKNFYETLASGSRLVRK